MGNRAVISIGKTKASPAIYLHWNGGPESVLAFLAAAKVLGVRSPGSDPSYFLARLTQIIANWMGGNLSVGVGTVGTLDADNGDNGLYVIGTDFEIAWRVYCNKGAPTTIDQLDADERKKFGEIMASAVEKSRALYENQ